MAKFFDGVGDKTSYLIQYHKALDLVYIAGSKDSFFGGKFI